MKRPVVTEDQIAAEVEAEVADASSHCRSACRTEAPAQAPQGTVTIAGSFQVLLGCEEDWQPACETTMLAYDADDNLWTATWTLPAGDYEYKAALNGAWDESYGVNAEQGGANIPLSVAEEQDVTFFYQPDTHWVSDTVNATLAIVAGDFQSELGCPGDWQADCLRALLQDPEADGTYVYTTYHIPAGDWKVKAVENQIIGQNYGEGGAQGGTALAFNIPAVGHEVTFTYTPADHMLNIAVSAEPVVTEEELAAEQVTAETPVETTETAATPLGEPNGPLTITIAGTIQSVLGCPGDWAPECDVTFLTYNPVFDILVGVVCPTRWQLRIQSSSQCVVGRKLRSERDGTRP